MERYAHVASLRSVGGGYEVALLAPENTEFNAATMRRGFGRYNPILRLFIFPASPDLTLLNFIKTYYTELCPICFNSSQACWHWKRHPSFQTLNAFFSNEPMEIPVTPDDERRILLSLNPAPAIIDQLTQASAQLRSAMGRTEAPRPTPRPRTHPAAPQATPTVVPGVRCAACGQVIPPGFDKSKDKKTEDEVYAECQHDFDEQTKICKRCHMAQRESSRFSLLEVD